MLLCSVSNCRLRLTREQRRLVCPLGHSFDIARSVKGANGSKREIVLLSHDAVLSQAQLELYGLADVF